jgi:hypothetical protein
MHMASDTPGDGNALVRWRVVPVEDDRQGVRRTGLLTPYLAEIMVADGVRAGRGGRLEVVVPSGTPELGLLWVLDRLAWLSTRGVRVTVRRDGGAGPRLQPDAA